MKDEAGNVIEVHCTVDMDSCSGSEGANRKIKGKTLHWVSAADAIPFEVAFVRAFAVCGRGFGGSGA